MKRRILGLKPGFVVWLVHDPGHRLAAALVLESSRGLGTGSRPWSGGGVFPRVGGQVDFSLAGWRLAGAILHGVGLAIVAPSSGNLGKVLVQREKVFVATGR